MLALSFPLELSFSPTTTPLLMHTHRGRHPPSLPLCTVRRYCSGTGCVLLHSVRMHTCIFLPPSCTLFHMVTVLVFFFIPPCLLTYLLTVTLTRLYNPTHTPPLRRTGVHTRKKPGNPADAGASAPSPDSPAGPRLGPATTQQRREVDRQQQVLVMARHHQVLLRVSGGQVHGQACS